MWACQPVDSMSSPSVAPLARCIIAITSAFLLLRAEASTSFVDAGSFVAVTFFAGLACFRFLGCLGALCVPPVCLLARAVFTARVLDALPVLEAPHACLYSGCIV